MPEIPVFTSQQGYGSGTATGGAISPATAGASMGALADGMERVATQFAAVAEQANRQAAAVESAKITGDVEMAAADLAEKYANDPDPSTAPARFRAELMGLHKSATAEIKNPLVMASVQERLARSGPVAYVHMLQRSAHAQKGLAQASALGEMSAGTLALAAATTEADRELALDQIGRASVRGVSVGALTPEQARNAASKARAEAIQSIATRNPEEANALLQRYRSAGMLDATHAVALENQLKHPLEVREGKAAAHQELGLGGSRGGQGDAAALARTATELGIDPVDLATLMSYETGGKMSPSIRGGKNNQHIGLIQFGAEEQAKYGANQQQSFQEQLVAVKKYLQDRGVRPGDDLTTLYRIVNGGNRNVPLTASDGNGTIEQHVGRMSGQHRENARKFLASADEGAAPQGPMSQADILAGEQRIASRLSGKPEALSAALTEYRQQIHLREGQFQAARAEFGKTMTDLDNSLKAGIDIQVPEDRIRAIYPKEQADALVRHLDISKRAGQAYKAIEFGSLEDIRAATGKMVGDAPADPTQDFTHRAQVAETFGKLVAARDAALKKDPAAYAARSPVAQAAAAGMDQPGGAERYIRTLLSEQTRMGVPDRDLRALGAEQAAALATAIRKQPPEKAVMSDVINNLKKQYGSEWTRVYGELVKHHLPGEYMIAGSMTEPEQQAGLALLQKGWAAIAENKDGMQGLQNTVGTKNVRMIDEELSAKLAPFNQTMAHNSAGAVGVMSNMKNSARVLAYMYMLTNGKDASDAASLAVDDLVTKKYDIEGTMRVPRGEMDAMRRATRLAQASMRAEDFSPVAGASNDDMAGLIRRGVWVPNADDTGLAFMLQVRNGGLHVARDRDGNRIQILNGTGGTFDNPLLFRSGNRAQGSSGAPANINWGPVR